MKLITEIFESEFTGNNSSMDSLKFTVRRASRALVFNQEGKMALLYVSNKNFHKLPGGGVETGENLVTALKREVKEEVGSQIDGIEELGLVIEYRNLNEFIQISYCYMCQTVGELEEPQYTEEEMDSGFQVLWVGIEEAIRKIEDDNPQCYAAQYIQKRELAILMAAKDLLERVNISYGRWKADCDLRL